VQVYSFLYGAYVHVYLFCAQCTHSTRCRTVTSFSSRSPNHERPSFDTHKVMIMDMVVEAPQNRQEAKANVSDADHVISAYRTITLFTFQGLG
jgi:hypothetical protein